MEAREFLSQHGVVYDSVSVDRSPVPRAEALELASRARRLIVKVGKDTLRFEAGRNRISREEADRYLVHEDGFLRVPVLVVGDLLVRGFTREIYREALDAPTGRGAAG